MSDLVDRHLPLTTKTFSSRPREEQGCKTKEAGACVAQDWGLTLAEVGSTPKSIHATDLCLRLNLIITPNFSVTPKQIPKVWNSVNRLFHRQKSAPLQDCSDTLANFFGNFFKDKIAKIRAVFQIGQSGQVSDDNVKPYLLTHHFHFLHSNYYMEKM